MHKRLHISVPLVILGSLFVFSSLFSQEGGAFHKAEKELHYTEVLSFSYENVSHTVELGVDSTGLPQHYYANLITPVCDDTICEILHLEVYWDLLGNYLGFDTLPGLALTKYDHDKFTAEEYHRLHEILQDAYSPLGDLLMIDLVSNAAKHSSGVIDASSGATSVDIANSVVPGGVYSCYILWHIVHPQTDSRLLAHTTSILDAELMTSMLESHDPRYQVYVLNALSDEDYLIHHQSVIASLSGASPTVIAYLMQNMPKAFLVHPDVQQAMCSLFTDFSVVSRYKFLLRLSECNGVLPSSLELLSEQISEMSYMQVQEFVGLLKKNSTRLTEVTTRKVQEVANAATYKYAYVLQELLIDLH